MSGAENPHTEYRCIVPGADTAVLFIHGICGTPRHFDFMLEQVPESLSVLNLLLEGHGAAARDFSRSSMEKWKSQVDSAIAALNASHAHVLVCAHSMGTLLALENAIENPGRVEKMFLLACPLRMKLGRRAIQNSLHTVFGDPKKDTPIHSAARHCSGVSTDKNPLSYLGWLPRYLELFALGRKVRTLLPGLKTPCLAFQSRRDELVSRRSEKLLSGHSSISLHILQSSMHYYYPAADREYLKKEFGKFITKEEA